MNYKEFKSVFVSAIPTHWEVKPLYTLCGFMQGKAHEPFVDENGEHICVNSRFVSTAGNKTKYCTENLTPANKYDILMVMSDLPNGRALAKAFFVQDDKSYAVNQRVCALTTLSINKKFLYYQLDRSPYFLMYNDGSNQTHLSNNIFKKYPILVPTNDEQQKIANFLDHETAKIDTLIAKQQQLIQLLKEKRQAVISHAVTKGLNPDAPMRDSGVEWLGEVPAHWDVSSLGYYSSISSGATPDRSKSQYWGGDVPWVKTGEVKYDEINETEEQITSDGVANSAVTLSPPGTLLMAMYGQGVTRGRVALLGISATYNQACAAITPNGKIWNKYLRFFFMAAYHAIRDGGNETSQLNLNVDIVSKFKITIPEMTEQQAIVEFLGAELNSFDLLIDKSYSATLFMQERRTALISAAVTGKIDVRNWVSPDASNTANTPDTSDSTATTNSDAVA